MYNEIKGNLGSDAEMPPGFGDSSPLGVLVESKH
jgi:hypothetical protein